MSANKKIAVCGDSFQAITDQNDPLTGSSLIGTHWSEIVSADCGYELLNLACPGSSNSVIVLQVLEAIELKVDFIVLCWSAGFGARVEYFNNLRIENNPMAMGPDLGDFHYRNRPHPYQKLNRKYSQTLTSSNIPSIPDNQLAAKLAMALPLKFVALRDSWIISYALRKLSNSKIPYLVFEAPPAWPNERPSPYINELAEFCREENIIYRKQLNLGAYNNTSPDMPQYHTSTESQIEIANYITKRIRELES